MKIYINCIDKTLNSLMPWQDKYEIKEILKIEIEPDTVTIYTEKDEVNEYYTKDVKNIKLLE